MYLMVHGRTCDVEPFDTYIITSKKVPIVGAAVDYTLTYTHETYVPISRNAVYVPSIDNNLISPFFLR